MNKAVLASHGINYDGGAARFLGDTELYETVLKSFPDDLSFPSASEAFDKGDCKQLFFNIHTLKGVAGELDMTRLYSASCALADALRGSALPEAARVEKLFAEVKSAYYEVLAGIAAA